MIFFSFGAATLGLAALCPELVGYYENREYVEGARDSLGRIESLNSQYEVLLDHLGTDPNLVRRTAMVTLGKEVSEPNTVYPAAGARELAVARKVLAAEAHVERASTMPVWLDRCIDPKRRCILFAAGSALVLISFVCFGRRKDDELTETD